MKQMGPEQTLFKILRQRSPCLQRPFNIGNLIDEEIRVGILFGASEQTPFFCARFLVRASVNRSKGGQMSANHKAIIEKVNAGFEKNDPEVFLGFCSDDVEWTMAGGEPKKGKASIREWVKSMEEMGPPKINTTAIISEGDLAACYGDMRHEGERRRYFLLFLRHLSLLRRQDHRT
jgi:hypothetical protein